MSLFSLPTPPPRLFYSLTFCAININMKIHVCQPKFSVNLFTRRLSRNTTDHQQILYIRHFYPLITLLYQGTACRAGYSPLGGHEVLHGTYLFIYSFIYFIYLFIHIFIYLFVYLFIYLFIFYIFIHSFIYLFIYLFIFDVFIKK